MTQDENFKGLYWDWFWGPKKTFLDSRDRSLVGNVQNLPVPPPKKEKNIVNRCELASIEAQQLEAVNTTCLLSRCGLDSLHIPDQLGGLHVRKVEHYLPEDRPCLLLVFYFPLISPSLGKFACLILQHQIPLEKKVWIEPAK